VSLAVAWSPSHEFVEPPVLPPLTMVSTGDLVPGTSYRVRGPLATGGMGELYEVEHEGLARVAVLKVLHARLRRRESMAQRVFDEARALAAIGAPHVPVVHDVGTLADGRPFLVMERLLGSDLRDDLRRLGPLSIPAASRIGVALLRALERVHRKGYVHRDVKLDNVFVCRDGRVVLLDFGIARRFDAGLRRTGQGLAMGTPRSMAPEQHLGEDVDARADLYAAGLVLYELVTGRGPFDDVEATPESLRLAHCRRLPAPPSARAPQPIPPAFERVVLRALEKREVHRFPSAAAMADALEAAAHLGDRFDDEPTVLQPCTTREEGSLSALF
jgi:serine/threonine protein kinase